MSSNKMPSPIQADVMCWTEPLAKGLPAPDTEAYENMIYFDLEAIRNAGLATYQHLPRHVEDLRISVEVVTDLLTTMRYGRAPGRPTMYIRTAYVPAVKREPWTYPEHILDDCLGGLARLQEHRSLFTTGISAAAATLQGFRESCGEHGG